MLTIQQVNKSFLPSIPNGQTPRTPRGGHVVDVLVYPSSIYESEPTIVDLPNVGEFTTFKKRVLLSKPADWTVRPLEAQSYDVVV